MLYKGNDLEQARLWVQTNLHEGVHCPCCKQYCRLYRRKLNSTMGLALILIYQHFKKYPHHQWLHIPAFLVQTKRDSTIAGGDAAKLRYWGLIERAIGERPDGSDRVGRYRITDVGKKFVEGSIAVPKYAYVYNQLLLRLSEEYTTIQETLGDKFSYSELMRS